MEVALPLTILATESFHRTNITKKISRASLIIHHITLLFLSYDTSIVLLTLPCLPHRLHRLRVDAVVPVLALPLNARLIAAALASPGSPRCHFYHSLRRPRIDALAPSASRRLVVLALLT